MRRNNQRLILEDTENIQTNVIDFLNNSNKKWLFIVAIPVLNEHA